MQSTLRQTQNMSLSKFAGQCQIRVHGLEYDGFEFPKNVVFGPNYKEKDSPFWKDAKEQALEKVLEYSNCTLLKLMDLLGTIRDEAVATYAVDVLNNWTGCEFLRMMALDGCFFLLLAFSILGIVSFISEAHPIFGIGCADANMARWVKSMFFVGNQIPYVVIGKLMELSFFQKLRETIELEQPLELAKKVLHKFLMGRQVRDPVDLIHCLQSIVLGSKGASNVATTRMVDGTDGFPSAKTLSELGISFAKLEGDLGSRAISYKPSTPSNVLCLPVLRVDKYTGVIFDCLRKYEIVQQEATGVEREASSFFKFLAELIRTPEDIEVLSSQGVILGQPEGLLGFLSSFSELVESEHLSHVRTQIVESFTIFP